MGVARGGERKNCLAGNTQRTAVMSCDCHVTGALSVDNCGLLLEQIVDRL